jgi:hypothetical protein
MSVFLFRNNVLFHFLTRRLVLLLVGLCGLIVIFRRVFFAFATGGEDKEEEVEEGVADVGSGTVLFCFCGTTFCGTAFCGTTFFGTDWFIARIWFIWSAHMTA